MLDAGILSEDDRVELLEGEVIAMSPIGSRHAACVNRLNALLSAHVGSAAVVSVQNLIVLDDYSEPQPDLALLQPRTDFYADSHPTPDDVLLLIEVADSSLAFDREEKLPIYAQAGIREVWIVDLVHQQIVVYAEPMAGKYLIKQQYAHGSTVVSTVLPAMRLAADTILG